MRNVVLIGVAFTLLAGCDKLQDPRTKNSTGTTAVASNPPGGGGGASGQPSVHAPSGVVLNPGNGGGSGGAVQAVRGAARRTIDQNELRNIQLFIDNASGASGQMPTLQQTLAALQQEAPQTYKLAQEKAIILTGTRSRQHIWAYTYNPTPSGEHLILTSSGIERLSGPALEQRVLAEQKQ